MCILISGQDGIVEQAHQMIEDFVCSLSVTIRTYKDRFLFILLGVLILES